MSGAGERPGRLGLRSRLIATFALGALSLSVLMGALVYFTARHTLVVEQQGAALRQAYANAALLRNALAASIPSIDAEVTSLDTGRATASLLNDDGRWFSTSLSISRSSLPTSLRSDVRSGHVSTVTSSQGSSPLLMVGVPIPSVRSSYYFVVDLSDRLGAHVGDRGLLAVEHHPKFPDVPYLYIGYVYDGTKEQIDDIFSPLAADSPKNEPYYPVGGHPAPRSPVRSAPG